MDLEKRLFGYLKKSLAIRVSIISIVAFLISLLIYSTGVFDKAEYATLDYRFLNLSQKNRADTNIVIVAIDQTSLDFFEKEEVGWPFPREFYSVLVDYLSDCQAKAILFDIDFSSREIDRLDVVASESEQRFAESIIKSGNVFLASTLHNDTASVQETGTFEKFLVKNFERIEVDKNFNFALLPLSSFQSGARGIGYVNVFPDKDGLIRRVPFFVRFQESAVVYLPLLVYATLNELNPEEIITSVSNIPGVKENEFLINWYGEAGIDKIFRYYSFHSLVVSGYKNKNKIEPDIAKNTFKDKIVIIGGTAVGLLDHKPVPVAAGEQFPGVEIHATVLSNLIKKDFVSTSSTVVNILILLILCFVSAYIFFKNHKIYFALIYNLLTGSIYTGIVLLLFYQFRLDLPLIIPLFSIVLSLILSGLSSYAIEGRQKRELKKVFSRYLSPLVIEELIESPDRVDFGGKEIEATIFFSDIKDFTNISEKCSAKELVTHLNRYFHLCTGIVMKYEAMLDKYIGDSVMALFGAPVAKSNHTVSGCYAALEIIKELKKFNQHNKENNSPIFETRIGLNTGKIVVGNIGTETHLDYTAIGDPVNLASRLEGVNKVFGTSIIISENTYASAKEHIEVRELDYISVKGKEQPVRIFELIGKKGEISDMQNEAIQLFSKGLKLYRDREFEQALSQFELVLKINSNDIAAQLYIERCQKLKSENPGVSWDGVFRLKEK